MSMQVESNKLNEAVEIVKKQMETAIEQHGLVPGMVPCVFHYFLGDPNSETAEVYVDWKWVDEKTVAGQELEDYEMFDDVQAVDYVYHVELQIKTPAQVLADYLVDSGFEFGGLEWQEFMRMVNGKNLSHKVNAQLRKK